MRIVIAAIGSCSAPKIRLPVYVQPGGMHEDLLGKHQSDGVSSLQLYIEMQGCNTLSHCKHRMQRQNACDAATVQKGH